MLIYFFLHLHAEPSGPPTSLVVLASGPSTLTMEWSAPLINADVVTEYFISCAPQNDPTNLRTITRLKLFFVPFYNLIPDTTYDCEVIARSVYGDSRPATASATTPPRESKYMYIHVHVQCTCIHGLLLHSELIVSLFIRCTMRCNIWGQPAELPA